MCTLRCIGQFKLIKPSTHLSYRSTFHRSRIEDWCICSSSVLLFSWSLLSEANRRDTKIFRLSKRDSTILFPLYKWDSTRTDSILILELIRAITGQTRILNSQQTVSQSLVTQELWASAIRQGLKAVRHTVSLSHCLVNQEQWASTSQGLKASRHSYAMANRQSLVTQ